MDKQTLNTIFGKCVDTDYKGRMILESGELNGKIERLKSFLDEPEKRTKVEDIQLQLMHAQLNAMIAYFEILVLRLQMLD